MAEWIKAEKGLESKPEVIAMASILGIDRYAVAGRLLAFWAWADTQTINGTIHHVNSEFIDAHFAQNCFSKSMTQVGWLHIYDDRIVIPNFKRHNGKSAKKRALQQRRASRFRNAKKRTNVTLDASP